MCGGVSFPQEIDIADLLCLIVYESPDDMPIQYFVDLTRQAWDEVRHTTMGMRRLQELGFSLAQCGAPVNRKSDQCAYCGSAV